MALGMLLAFASRTLVAAAKHAPLTLPLETVQEASDAQERLFPGRVCAVQEVEIVPQVSGEIMEVLFTNGAIVEAGTVLYRIDRVKYQAAVLNARAAVAEAKAKHDYAVAAYERHNRLTDLKAVSEDATQNALSERDRTQAAYEAARANLLVAEDDLAHCDIKAPIGGKLGSTKYTKGNYVTPQSGTLVLLVQTQPVRVRFALSNADFISMFEGKSHILREKGLARITLANGAPFPEEGEIEYTENVSDEQTDTVQAYALLRNEQRMLRPGGTVGVALSRRDGVKKAAVSPSAILQDIRGPYVWLVPESGLAEKRYIVRGTLTEDLQIVESGLKPGETVVSDGVHKVREGQPILPAEK